MLQTARINAFFDLHVHPQITLLGRSRPRFLVLGWTGYLVALLLTQGLAAARGLSGAVMLLVAICAAATFLGQAMLVKIWLGRERLVYYHDLLAVLATSAGLLWLLRKPVLPYLDLTLLGVGAMLAFGRLGCLMAGCCHGQPADWGVCYRQEHVETGFPAHLAGVRLFPLQACEAGWVALAVAAGCLRLLAGAAPGETLSLYLLAYAAGRFVLEFLRGDPERSYAFGYSEAQWTSLLLTLAILALEMLGWLPLLPIQLAGGATLLLAAGGIALRRRLRPNADPGLLQASHLDEIARAVSQLSPSSQVQIVTTSLGLHISASLVPPEAQPVKSHPEVGERRLLYAFSRQPEALTPAAAQSVARLVRRLKHPQAAGELLSGAPGVFHWICSVGMEPQKE